jgi:hypothetical protein
MGERIVRSTTIQSLDYGKVTYHDDDWWFHVIVDLGTVEVIAKPTTLKKFQSLKTRIDRDIFKTAASLGLETNSSTYGAGHIHIDRETSGLGSDPILFRNFIVDFFNHDEIASGILEDDEDNALAVSKLSDRAKSSLRRAIALFDSSAKGQQDLDSMILAINKAYMENKTPPKEDEAKFQALNLLHPETVEIRSLRMQRDMGDFLKVIRLFQNRIDYLKTRKDQLIPLERMEEKQDIGSRLRRFRLYVTESRLKWKDYKDLLNEEHLQALKDLQTEECILEQLPK